MRRPPFSTVAQQLLMLAISHENACDYGNGALPRSSLSGIRSPMPPGAWVELRYTYAHDSASGVPQGSGIPLAEPARGISRPVVYGFARRWPSAPSFGH